LRSLVTLFFAFALAVPGIGSGAEPILRIGGPGNQTAPSMAASYLAFVDDLGGAPNVFVQALLSGAISPITFDGLAVGGPAAAGTVVALRRDGSVGVYDAQSSAEMFSIPAAGTGRIALTGSVVAWDQDAAGGEDVGWQELRPSAQPEVLELPGRQHSVAAIFDWLAYIDDGGAGEVHLVDTRVGTDVVVFAGANGSSRALLDVSLWAPDSKTLPLVAVTVAGTSGAEIAIASPVGGVYREIDRLTIPGGKAHAQIVGDWVGFEDLSTGVSQVVLWDRPAKGLAIPAPTGLPQELHDLVSADAGLRVVWADRRGGDFDIYEYVATLPVDEVPLPPPGVEPVRCTDAAATVLADFTVQGAATAPWPHHGRGERGEGNDDHDGLDHHDREDDGDSRHRSDGWHLAQKGAHDGRWHAAWRWRAAGGMRFPAEVATRVLVCIESMDVASAWVGVGSAVVAAPSDFRVGPVTLEARLTVPAGDGRVGAVIAGKRGCTLRVRVLADPGGGGNGAPDGTTCSAGGDCPPTPRGLVRKATSGCGTAGGFGSLASLLFTGLLALRPPRRRARA